jgi:hypothetical protein
MVERREALRPTSLGARGSPCRARWVRYSRLKGARWCPGASRRSTPSLGFARDWQTSDASRRENKKPWLFEIRIQKFRKATRHTPPSFRDPPPELEFTRVRHYCPSRLQPTWMRRPGIHSPCVGGWMLNANTVVMDSGLARRARPGMTSCVDETKRKARARARAFRLLNLLRDQAAGVNSFDALALIGSAVSVAIFLVSSASSLACAVRVSNCFLL